MTPTPDPEPRRLIASFRVGEKQAGLRLDRFLQNRIPKLSRASIQEAILTRVALGHGRRPKPALILHEGDVVHIREVVLDEPELARELWPRILYEDEDLIAVDKPAGLPVHANRRAVRNQLIYWLRDRHGPLVALAHRIDRETSGVVLCTRSADAARPLAADFAAGRVHKEYLAIVAPVPPEHFACDLAIGADTLSTVHIKQGTGVADGRPSRTRFSRETVRGDGNAALVRAFPETGRRHQIRVHLAALGFPVVGDKLYAAGERHFLNYAARGITPEMLAALGAARQMLHAAVLEVRHPRTGRVLRIEAPLPPDFAACMAART